MTMHFIRTLSNHTKNAHMLLIKQRTFRNRSSKTGGFAHQYFLILLTLTGARLGICTRYQPWKVT